MHVERYWSNLGASFEMIINSVQFIKCINRVKIPNQYTVHNSSDLPSSKRLCKGSNYIGLNAKKVNFYRHNKYQIAEEFILNQVETAKRKGKYFIY